CRRCHGRHLQYDRLPYEECLPETARAFQVGGRGQGPSGQPDRLIKFLPMLVVSNPHHSAYSPECTFPVVLAGETERVIVRHRFRTTIFEEGHDQSFDPCGNKGWHSAAGGGHPWRGRSICELRWPVHVTRLAIW